MSIAHLRRWFLALVSLAMLMNWPMELAAGGPENMLLVVNRDHPTSLLLANHYVSLRKIPFCNVVYLSGIPDSTKISVKEFNELILSPVFAHIRDNKLNNQIDYIVYSSGFPTAVDITDHQKRFLEILHKIEGTNAKKMADVFLPTASLTSLTYFGKHVLANEPSYLSLEANLYYRQSTKVIFERAFPPNIQKEFDAQRKASIGKSPEQAIQFLEGLAKQHPQQVAVSYSLAQAYARSGNSEKAIAWLTQAIRSGWCYRQRTLNDPEFLPLAKNPLFLGLVERLPNSVSENLPTFGFKSRYVWAPNGFLNGTSDTGSQYVLSTMLSVNSKFGISERDSLNQLHQSVAADFTFPKGKFYFCETSDVRTKTRQPNFDSVIKQLQDLGEESHVSHDTMPLNGTALGATLGVARFEWTKSKTKIQPGAIVENLTSYGGDFSRDAHTRLTEFLRYGAAGSSGTVTEPYALQQKFPHPMIHVHYRKGCTLAEAFYQSVSGPFQLLIVGDALCRPWAKPIQLEITGLKPLDTVKGQVNLQLKVVSAVKVDAIEIYLDGVWQGRQPLGDIQVDTRTLNDGFHELRICAIESGPLQSQFNTIVPFVVNNHENSLTLTTNQNVVSENDVIRLEIQASSSKEVALFLNTLELGKIQGKQGTFEVNARHLGRGPVQLRARATDDEGQQFESIPLSIQVNGKIRETTH